MSASSPALPAHRKANTNTGMSNGLLGIMCFLTSEMGLFGSLIFMYLYTRRASPVWPPTNAAVVLKPFDWQLPTVNTVVLLSSGVTMHFAFQALKRGNVQRMLQLLVLTIILGVAFLSGQVYEYNNLINNEHLTMAVNIYGASFFTLTGLHGIHVTGGVIFLLIILFGTIKGKYSAENTMVPHAATLYWHFVDAVWVVLFALFYLTVP